MFLEIRHEGCAARSHSGGVARMGLMLAMNVTVGVADVNLAKLGEEIDAGAIGSPEFGAAGFPIANIAGEQGATEIIGCFLQGLEEGTVARGHIVSHLLQIDGQEIGEMGDPESGVEAGNNRALRAGLTAKLLRLISIGFHTLVY